MRITTGTDIIEIERIKNSIEKFGDTFLNTIFTQKEIEFCESHKNQKYQHYAARFAAKEATFKAAVFKALSFYYKECKWKEYEILTEPNGKPIINLLSQIPNIESIDISLSHCKTYAVANVVAIIK